MPRFRWVGASTMLGCTLAGTPSVDAPGVVDATLSATCAQGPRGTIWRFQASIDDVRTDRIDDLQADVYERTDHALVQSFHLYREPGTTSWLSEWQQHGLGCAPDEQEATFLMWGRDGGRALGTVSVESLHP